MDSKVFRPMIKAFPVVRLRKRFCSPGIRHGISLPFPITRFSDIAAIMVIFIALMLAKVIVTIELNSYSGGKMKNLMRVLLFVASVSTTAFAETPDHFSFTFKTTQGDIDFECPKGWSPLGEQRLYELVTTGFFSNTAFFRVITDFVAQFGISGDPATAARWENATIADDPVVASNVAGTLSFATAGPNTRTTQVYINLVDNVRLDEYGFSPVCKISNADGLTIARKLYAGYGEAPDQGLITEQGDEYLKANFPLLDYVQSAVLK